MYTRLTAFFLILIPLAHAQFGFFEHMFGHHDHDQGHEHYQQQQQRGSPGSSQWQVHAEAVSCSQYLCPDTLTCVSRPGECPCPNVEDIKCTIPDAQDKEDLTVVCTRGEGECAAVKRLMYSHSA
ncbi:hypothetical protein BV22DRAFT_48035 [Leucogyrophana mollusca]|uniref:Uncharacterized protein n=1 Tax=Leucogyrophana mollusca TaxID=85980 RepID=A0ACB8C0M9_9AGAM|nr:hypothetical protein BV22DRAFT_48035 [Leucogyrophana mollusca]